MSDDSTTQTGGIVFVKRDNVGPSNQNMFSYDTVFAIYFCKHVFDGKFYEHFC